MNADDRTLERELRKAATDRAMMAVELTKAMDARDALGVRCERAERRAAELTRALGEELDAIKTRASDDERTRARIASENELLRRQVELLSEKAKVQEEHYGKTRDALETTEALRAAEARMAGETMRRANDELNETRAEIKRRLERELELMRELQAYGEKFEEFKGAVTKNDASLEAFAREVREAKMASLESEKKYLEVSMQMKKSNVQLIELASEREALRGRVQQLENQNIGLEKLSRTLAERLKAANGTEA